MAAAIGEYDRVMGRNGELPWSKRLTPDMKRFVTLTTPYPVIMGSATWDSIPPKYRPLTDRKNFVVSSRDADAFPGATRCLSFYAALSSADVSEAGGKVFIIGGEKIYKLGLASAHRLELTLVGEHVEGDRYFPDYEKAGFTRVIERTVEPDFEPRLTYLTLERV